MHHTVFRCSKSGRGGQDGVLDILRKHVSVAEIDQNQSGQLTFVFCCAHNVVSGSRFCFFLNFFLCVDDGDTFFDFEDGGHGRVI